MAVRVLVRHLSGAKDNQVEDFAADNFNELVLGRDPGAGIVFDAAGADLVSRRHAAIRRKAGADAGYEIVDLGSSNGTFVNGARIAGETELHPGDTVELGQGGPKLSFDLDPRPAARTRVVQPVAATRVVATRVLAPPPEPARTTILPPPGPGEAKQGVGRETVVRMLSEQKRSTNRVWIISGAAAAVLIAAVGGVLYWTGRQHEVQLAQQIANSQAQTEDRLKSTMAKQGMTPAQVAENYARATVLINMSWKLYDKASGKQVFQKVFVDQGHQYPAYIRAGENTFVRWLTLDDQGGRNWPIGSAGHGSGFVVGEQGFILTNRHVAAEWTLPYDSDEQGVWVTQQENPKQKIQGGHFAPFKVVGAWVPSLGGYLFDANRPVSLGKSEFEGRDETLDVRFAGSRNGNSARLLRVSTDADVALIKIESPQSLLKVPLADPSYQVRQGDHIIELGYPASSAEQYATTQHNEMDTTYTNKELVPTPTLTEGIVARTLGGASQSEDGAKISSNFGDVYLTTDNATGAGNSGGPVFNTDGKVIGLHTYAISAGRDRNESGAVPIKYGLRLMQMQ